MLNSPALAPSWNSQKQVHQKAGTTVGPVRGADLPAVTVDDPVGDREAQPAAALGLVRRAPEPVEHARQVGGLDPRPIVVNRERDPIPGASHLDRNVPPLWCVADRVVQQDPGQLSEPYRIAGEWRRLHVQ